MAQVKTLTPIGDPDPETGVQRYEITVKFTAHGQPEFTQEIMSALSGSDLEAQMKAYADDYEQGWKNGNGFI